MPRQEPVEDGIEVCEEKSYRFSAGKVASILADYLKRSGQDIPSQEPYLVKPPSNYDDRDEPLRSVKLKFSRKEK